MKTYKEIPELKSEREEFDFWVSEDSTEYIDWTKAKQTNFPNLKKNIQRNYA